MAGPALQKMPWEEYADASQETAPVAASTPSATPAPAVVAAASGPWDEYKTPSIAPIDNSGTREIGGLPDELPAQPKSKMSPEDEAAVIHMVRTHADPSQIRQFMASKGFEFANLDQVQAARDRPGGGVNNQPVYQFPEVKAVDNPNDGPNPAAGNIGKAVDSSISAAVHGALSDIPGYDHAAAAGRAIDNTLLGKTGRSFGDEFSYQDDLQHGRVQGEEAEHPYLRIGGQIAGGFAIPTGIEGVGYRAGAEALRSGRTMLEARQVAKAAIRNRLTATSGIYGASHGALGADNTQDALAGAITEGSIGAATGGLLGQAGRLKADSVVSSIPGDAQATLMAATRQNIRLLPQDVGGEGVGRATQGAAQSTFGSAVVRRAADRLYGDFRDRVGEIAGDSQAPVDVGNIVGQRMQQAADAGIAAADRASGTIENAVGRPTDQTGAGQLIQRGVSRFMDATAERAKTLYDAIPIDPNHPGSLENSRNLLGSMTSGMASNPDLGRIFQSPRLRGYRDALTPVIEPITETVDNRAGGGGLVTRTIGTRQVGGNLSWEDLSEFRTRVGDMLSDPQLSDGIAPRQLRALYGALSSDMEATAQSAGPDAFRSWKRANNYYDGRMKRINDTFSMVLGPRKDATPNEAFSSMQNMLKPGSSGNASAFSRILRSMPIGDANAVRATIVNSQRGGPQFDPDRFARAWGEISERGKSALLPQPGMRQIMDDAASRAVAETRNPFAGMSGEAVFGKLESMASNKGDSSRFRDMIASLSPDEANSVRAAFIKQGGSAPAGQQNAAGDAFSISKWLTRWNTLSPSAKTTLFGAGDLRVNMEDLAKVAEKVKASERLAGHSNTGAVNGFNATTGGLAAAAGAILTGHPIIAAGAAAPALYQRLSAELLTSPGFVKWLAGAPKTKLRPEVYLARLSKVAKSEPAIANEVLQLQQRLTSAFTSSPTRLAADESPDSVRNGQGNATDQQSQGNSLQP